MLALKTTPFHARTAALMQGNQWRRWAGHTVASAYELTPDRELMAIRNACALIDISPLFKYHVRGPDALRFLDRLVTRDLMLAVLKVVGIRLTAGQAAKVVPIAGQAVSAALTFSALKYVCEQHIKQCIAVSRQLALPAPQR